MSEFIVYSFELKTEYRSLEDRYRLSCNIVANIWEGGDGFFEVLLLYKEIIGVVGWDYVDADTGIC